MRQRAATEGSSWGLWAASAPESHLLGVRVRPTFWLRALLPAPLQASCRPAGPIQGSWHGASVLQTLAFIRFAA